MTKIRELVSSLSSAQQELFRKRQVILSFEGFIEQLSQTPRPLIRNSCHYIFDSILHFGVRDLDPELALEKVRYKLFDKREGRCGPIVGGEQVQAELVRILNSFVKQGFSNKLVLMHGPNGSAKSSTMEMIQRGMESYSMTDEGAVYTFNWIFPVDRGSAPAMKGESGPIGFGDRSGRHDISKHQSWALLDETQIASKIPSEFRENPMYLIPMPQREAWLREWIGKAEGKRPEDVDLPGHILGPGLSKRNQQILENLLAGYDGDLSKVFRHVQVQRFFYSRQYRVGISTVEPQMSIDAVEKQLTMDSNFANIPAVLHNIRLHEAFGQLVEANRGCLEFSDMLKRPLEAFKYLLTTVENGTVNLSTSMAHLDLVFFGTTNEQHLDAFKTVPGFTSFRERFELVTVPYLIVPSLEEKIYERDADVLSKMGKVAPHAIRSLCVWAVMTRLKKPDPEHYETKYRPLVARLGPRDKVNLIEGRPLSEVFNAKEVAILRDLRAQILRESEGTVVYEGRFGASPREVRAILYRAAHNVDHLTLTPMAIFDELKNLCRDRSVYEFLQFEPRGKYHDALQFIKDIENDFVENFEREILQSMSLVEEHEYDQLIRRYIENVVAEVKKERIINPTTGEREAPNQKLMEEIEKLLGVTTSAQKHREELIGRVAAFSLENPNSEVNIQVIFSDLYEKIQKHYYEEKKKSIDEIFHAVIMLENEKEGDLDGKVKRAAIQTLENLDVRFGYDKTSAIACLKFYLTQSKAAKK